MQNIICINKNIVIILPHISQKRNGSEKWNLYFDPVKKVGLLSDFIIVFILCLILYY